jgi:xylulokinase
MNEMAAKVPVGSNGITVIPFGNGAERVLENKNPGAAILGINFNNHTRENIIRAAQEGIVFSFCYGMEIMRGMGMDINKIHAGKANMFLSDIFRNTLASVSGATIELYDTDGSVGAAKAAGIGAGIYKDNTEAFATLEKLNNIEPDTTNKAQYQEAYERWKEVVAKI